MSTIKERQQQDDKRRIAYEYYISKGYTPQASAAIVGNLVHESGLSTSIEGDKGYSGGSSYGLAQWRGERLQRLKQKYGDNWTDFKNQLEFVDYELNNTHINAGNKLRAETDLYKAGEIFSDLYERPAKKYAQNINRQQAVNSIYSWAANKKDITPENVTQKFTNFEADPTLPNFAPQTQQAQQVIAQKEPTQQEQAEKNLETKTNEYNFIQDYLNQQPIAPQYTQAIPQQQTPIETPDFLGQYAQVSSFVENPLMQNGGRVQNDKQWLSNWYRNRVLPDENLQKTYLEDKPYYMQTSSNIPDPTYVSNLSKGATGRADYKNKKIYVTTSAQPSVFLHEATHWTDNFPSLMRTLHQDVVNQNITPKDKTQGIYKEKYDYFSNPDEIHARIQVLRQKAGIKPDQTVTPEFLDSFLEKYKGDVENINDLLNLTDKKGLLEMLNYMAANTNNQEQRYYAQNGGSVPVSANGLYDYPNQQVLVPTQGNITMKGINYPVMGVSMQTGEKKVMMPNIQNYFFNNTSSVLEIPLKK